MRVSFGDEFQLFMASVFTMALEVFGHLRLSECLSDTKYI